MATQQDVAAYLRQKGVGESTIGDEAGYLAEHYGEDWQNAAENALGGYLQRTRSGGDRSQGGYNTNEGDPEIMNAPYRPPEGPTGGGQGPFSGGAVGGPDYGAFWQSTNQQLQNWIQAQNQRQAADDARRQQYEDQVRSTLMGIMGQGTPTAESVAQSPEARSYQRLAERSQQLLRAQNAERAAQMGTGGVAAGQTPRGDVAYAGGTPTFDEKTGQYVQGGGPTTELGGALSSGIEQGNRELAERTYGQQSQLLARELDARRNQLMQALQLGAGLMTNEQQQSLQRELSQISNATSRLGLAQQGQLGMGQLALGQGQLNQQLMNALLQNEQYYSGLGADIGYKQALLNQSPYQYLF